MADGVDWGASSRYGPSVEPLSPRTDDMAHEELQAENTRLLGQIRALELHLELCHDCTWGPDG